MGVCLLLTIDICLLITVYHFIKKSIGAVVFLFDMVPGFQKKVLLPLKVKHAQINGQPRNILEKNQNCLNWLNFYNWCSKMT